MVALVTRVPRTSIPTALHLTSYNSSTSFYATAMSAVLWRSQASLCWSQTRVWNCLCLECFVCHERSFVELWWDIMLQKWQPDPWTSSTMPKEVFVRTISLTSLSSTILDLPTRRLPGGLFPPKIPLTHKALIHYTRQNWRPHFQQNGVGDKFLHVERQLPKTWGILVGRRGSATTWKEDVQVVVSE